ncbi:MAG TPA: hypothetical protein VF631_04490 [Allosphingosinicella sp.]|jgi:hypothetical protein|uniref:hypothetical protein n=1 Tax=Allosphingosinicella sp. TaxID=2823234 RepID=UPI002F285812
MRAGLVGLAALALLTACGGGGQEGGLTADENAELNNAANMLDSAPEALNGADETGLDTGQANGTPAKQ